MSNTPSTVKEAIAKINHSQGGAGKYVSEAKPILYETGELERVVKNVFDEYRPPQDEIDKALAGGARTKEKSWDAPLNGFQGVATAERWAYAVRSEINGFLHMLKTTQPGGDWRILEGGIGFYERKYRGVTGVKIDEKTDKLLNIYRADSMRMHLLMVYHVVDMAAADEDRYIGGRPSTGEGMRDSQLLKQLVGILGQQNASEPADQAIINAQQTEINEGKAEMMKLRTEFAKLAALVKNASKGDA